MWNPLSNVTINVAEIIPTAYDTEDAVVYPMSYNYRIEPLLLRRLEILADVLGMRVIAVDTPGITMDFNAPERTRPTRMPVRTILEVSKGDFRTLASIQMEAVRQTTGIPDTSWRLLGESFGAQMVSAMSLTARCISLDIVEPVNLNRLSLNQLIRLGQLLAETEEVRRRDLIKINEDAEWGFFPPFEDTSELHSRADAHFKRFSRQGWWALVSALGLRSGLASTFISLPRVRHIGLWRGKDSSVSCGSVHTLEDQLAGLDAQVNEFELVGGEIPAGQHILTSFVKCRVW